MRNSSSQKEPKEAHSKKTRKRKWHHESKAKQGRVEKKFERSSQSRAKFDQGMKIIKSKIKLLKNAVHFDLDFINDYQPFKIVTTTIGVRAVSFSAPEMAP